MHDLQSTKFCSVVTTQNHFRGSATQRRLTVIRICVFSMMTMVRRALLPMPAGYTMRPCDRSGTRHAFCRTSCRVVYVARQPIYSSESDHWHGKCHRSCLCKARSHRTDKQAGHRQKRWRGFPCSQCYSPCRPSYNTLNAMGCKECIKLGSKNHSQGLHYNERSCL